MLHHVLHKNHQPSGYLIHQKARKAFTLRAFRTLADDSGIAAEEFGKLAESE